MEVQGQNASLAGCRQLEHGSAGAERDPHTGFAFQAAGPMLGLADGITTGRAAEWIVLPKTRFPWNWGS